MSNTLDYHQLREEFRKIEIAERAKKRVGFRDLNAHEVSASNNNSSEDSKSLLAKRRKQEFWEYLANCPINN